MRDYWRFQIKMCEVGIYVVYRIQHLKRTFRRYKKATTEGYIQQRRKVKSTLTNYKLNLPSPKS